MDLDAEMRKLQEEARHELAQRDAADAAAAELPPTPIPEELKEKPKEKKPKKKAKARKKAAPAEDDALGALGKATAALNAAKAANDLAQKFDPDVLAEAKELAEMAGEVDVEKMSLMSKIGWGAGGLIIFAVLWELVLAPIFWGLAGLALIVLIFIGVLKLMGFGKKDGEEEEEEDE